MATTTKRKPRERVNPEPQSQSRASNSAAILSEEEEDRQDIEDVRLAREEAEREGYIPWEQLKRELGF